MKAQRRQELRTNELSQQIDHVGEYVKQNAAVLTAIIVAAAAIVGGTFWYMRHQQNNLMDAWARLSDRSAATDPAAKIDSYREVANENLDPELTVAAWLRVGETAMAAMYKSSKDAAAAPDKNYAQTADDAFNKVLSLNPKDKMTVAAANMGLGLLAEDRGDLERAKQSYKKISDDPELADCPIKQQAAWRIENMTSWSSPVKFPPAPPPASQPANSPPSLAPGPGGLPPGAERVSPSEVPEAIRKAAREGLLNPSTQPAGK